MKERLVRSPDIIAMDSSEKCNVVRSYDINMHEAKVNEPNVQVMKERLERSPKYFCRNCTTNLCRDCFKAACLSHDVLWEGNRMFRCASSFHNHTAKLKE